MNQNSVFISGRVSRIDEMRISPQSGTAYISFGVGCNRMSKEKKADFFNCIAFGKTAELLHQYCEKGSRIGIKGTWNANQYEKDGEKRTYHSVSVNSIEFLGTAKKETQAEKESISEFPF